MRIKCRSRLTADETSSRPFTAFVKRNCVLIERIGFLFTLVVVRFIFPRMVYDRLWKNVPLKRCILRRILIRLQRMFSSDCIVEFDVDYINSFLVEIFSTFHKIFSEEFIIEHICVYNNLQITV